MAEAEAQAAAASEGAGAGALVRYEAEDGVAVLTLDDPPANTYTYEMMRQLDAAVLRARMDEAVNVVVITGGGEKFFCAGANIRTLTEMTPTFKYYFCLHANETLSRLEQTPKLVIAAINGHCVGGGLEVALAADLRVARKGAGKMGLPEVSLGVLPGTGGTQRLVRVVGKSRAIELMAAGELFDFERGAELGLVSHLFEAATAADLPTTRASLCVPPVPGSTPSETSGSPILPAPRRAMRMSAARATSSPPPTQWPLTAATTSFGVCSRRESVSLAWRQK